MKQNKANHNKTVKVIQYVKNRIIGNQQWLLYLLIFTVVVHTIRHSKIK